MTAIREDQQRYQLRDLLRYRLRDQQRGRRIAAFRLAGAGLHGFAFFDISICTGNSL
jgi:hypothetical protein